MRQASHLLQQEEEYRQRHHYQGHHRKCEGGGIPYHERRLLRQHIEQRELMALGLHTHHEAQHYQNQQRRIEHTPAQVVEYLPPADGVHLVLHLLALLVPHLVFQPPNHLPVAASPAVVALCVVNVVRRVVVEELHIVYQAAPYVTSLDQVMAQNEVLGERALQHLLEYTQVVYALAAERALVEDVLIQLERRCRIYVQPAQSGEKLRIATLVRHLDVHVHARLHNAVAAVHPAAVSAQLRTVQRMRHRTHQFLRRVEHQFGVRIQGDDELYRASTAGLRPIVPVQPARHRLAAEAFRPLLLTGLAQQQLVEVQYGAAFALMAQPTSFALAPRPLSIDKVEYLRPVFLVELLHLLHSGLDHLVVPRCVLILIRRRIAYQRVVQVLLSECRRPVRRSVAILTI